MLFQRFGKERRRTCRRENIDTPTMLEIENNGERFVTNKAILKDISATGIRFELSIDEPIPQLNHFVHLPIKFRLPESGEIINAEVRVVRVYAFDETDKHIYGIAFEFTNLPKNCVSPICAFANQHHQ